MCPPSWLARENTVALLADFASLGDEISLDL